MGRGRAPCCDKSKVRTGPWSSDEDLRLIQFIQNHGHANWRALPKQAGLLRCGKSCRLRWLNYLSPDIKRGHFTLEEEQSIIKLHNSFGNKWSKIAACLPGRTDNEIKNVWNTHLKKRLKISNSDTNNNRLIDCNYTSSCTSNSSITGDDENLENLFGYQGSDQENEVCPKINSTHPSDNSEQIQLEATYDDNGKTEIPSDFDVDFFWEVMDSISDVPLLQDNSKSDGEIEIGKWLRKLESELGLTTSDGDQELHLEPEISPAALDCLPLSPCFSQYIGF